MAKLKSRYTKHSNPCNYCNKISCKQCFHRKNKTNYPNKELNIGRKVEMEHTDSKMIADKIARDHLKEDSKYYTKLIKCKL